MKKIGLLTINGDGNYGNKLQNYAMMHVLGRFGIVKNLKRYDNYETRSLMAIKIRRAIKPLFMLVKQILKKEYCYNRNQTFLKFNKYIQSEKGYICKTTNYNKLNKRYDYFVCGSDQVWNPLLYPDMYINMLGFAGEGKKIAVAPSISVDVLSKTQEQMFGELLKNFNYLSCREEQGAELLRKITKKEVESLIDPTLMLTAEEWDSIAKRPKFHGVNKKYALLYFLGDLNEDYQNIIREIRDFYGLEIINILDKKSKYYSCGPSEFIYLIKNSEIVLTDSFHGSVFSYIYNKPFRIFYRQGECGYMNSRLINLINKLNLKESTYLKKGDAIDDIMNVNYDKEFLKRENEKFNKYLKKIFNN